MVKPQAFFDRAALQYADYAYMMELGRIVLEATRGEILANEDMRGFYLGLGEGEKRGVQEPEDL